MYKPNNPKKIQRMSIGALERHELNQAISWLYCRWFVKFTSYIINSLNATFSSGSWRIFTLSIESCTPDWLLQGSLC
jgi:hypothetical protein